MMREMKDGQIKQEKSVLEKVPVIPLKYIFSAEKNPIKAGPFGSQLSGTDLLNEESEYWVYNQRAVIDNIFSEGCAFISKEKYDSMSSFQVKCGDILVTTRGTIGRIARVPEGHKPGILHPCIIRFRIDERKYSYKLLKLLFNVSDYINRQVLYLSNATTIDVIYSETLKKISLPDLDIEQQHRIADFLDAKCAEIDALAADIQAEIDTLEQYKRSVIFETVSHGINSSKMKQTDSDVWVSIPEDWELIDIKYLFRIVKRIAGKEGYDILAVTQKGIRIKDISNNEGQIASDYSGYQFVYPTDYVMNHMDLLTGWVDCSNYFGVTSPDYRVFCLQDKEAHDLQYYKYIMQCCYMCRIFYSLGQGVSTLGRWRLQTESFLNFKVPVPPLQAQKDIAKYLDGIITEADLLIDKKKEQISSLDSYKKSLIYEYVTGKKEVPVA